ncbi:MAG: EAL domain-containing protein, partial [Gammaproteobacteria bacterium]|nr:EAL domain-containing protein [Gammaproteobacteria bacterium]
RTIRQSKNDLDLPIIVLTGAHDIESLRAAYDEGATDFITKPINWHLFSQRIKFALRDKALYDQLTENQQRLEIANRIAKIGYWNWNVKESRIFLSQQAQDVLGLHGDNSFTLTEYMKNISESDRDVFFEQFCNNIDARNDTTIGYRIVSGEREIQVRQIIRAVYKNDYFFGLVGTVQDVTDEQNRERLIAYQQKYDYLTDLPNRAHLTEHVAQSINDASDSPQNLALLLLAIREFKLINDAYGNEQGDALLYLLAKRLRAITHLGSFPSRIGGDTFGMAIKGFSDIEEVELYADNMLSQLKQAYLIGGVNREVEFNVGVAVYPLETSTAEGLFLGAESALQDSKRIRSQQYSFFTKEMDAAAKQRLAMEVELRTAIKERQFVVYYQPQVCLTTGALIGVEALVRWIHPEKGLVPPLSFIPIAEKTGLIIPIGEQIINIAFEHLSEWTASHSQPLVVGINLSPRQFTDRALVDKVSQLLKFHKIDAQSVDFEITESMAMGDFSQALGILHALRAQGLKTSMDDFGTGYSSLSYLSKMPIDVLKVDRAFVKDINENGENGQIAKAIITMAHSMGLKVIAEGAETAHQISYLKQVQCDIVQGFYYSPPIPIDKLYQFKVPTIQ